MDPKKHLTLRALAAVLPDGLPLRLYIFSILRVLANFLDVLGLAMVAALVTVLNSGEFDGSRFYATLGSSVTIALSLDEVLFLSMITVLIFVLKSAFSIWLKLSTARVVAAVETEVSKILTVDYFYGNRRQLFGEGGSLSEFQNRAISSAEGLALFMNARLSAIAEFSLLLLLVMTLFIFSPTTTVVALAYLAIVMTLLGRVVRKKIQRNSRKLMEASEASLSVSKDLFGIYREARVSGKLFNWIDDFTARRDISSSRRAATYTLSSLPRYVIETSLVFGIFGFLATVIILGDIQSQATTLGVFLAGGLRLVALLIPLQASLNQMTDGSERGTLAFEKLSSIYRRKVDTTETDSKISNLDRPFGLSVKNVSFSYEQGRNTLKKVTFEAKLGEKTAIVGPSGGGKSTLFELCSGFAKPDYGEIQIAGMAPEDLISKHDGSLGVVPQRPHLVKGTLAQNVSLSTDEDTDFQRVGECLEQVGLGKFSLEGGLVRLVEPDSGTFSGGEIQRIGIARALYGRPGILFLDEATSGLDAESEKEISQLIDSFRGKITVVLIAHRLINVKTADQIIYLDQGRVVANGSFRELQRTLPDFRNAIDLNSIDKHSEK